MTVSWLEKSHIESAPGTCGVKPRIAVARIRVQDIVFWTKEGRSPVEIVTSFPPWTLVDVYAALASHHDNRIVDHCGRGSLFGSGTKTSS